MGWCAVQPGKASSERASEGVRKRKDKEYSSVQIFPHVMGPRSRLMHMSTEQLEPENRWKGK